MQALGIVRDGYNARFLPAGDSTAWRAAISHYLEHPEEAEEMGRAGRALVDAGINMERYVCEMVEVIVAVPRARKG